MSGGKWGIILGAWGWVGHFGRVGVGRWGIILGEWGIILGG